MKRLQLVWTAFALWAAACTAVTAQACEKKSGASASAVTASASTACPSVMAAHCSAAQAAACQANGASAATAMTADAKCPVTAACPTAVASECAKHASAAAAVVASAAAASECSSKHASAAAAECPGMAGTTAHACPGMSKTSASAVTAGASGQCKGGGLVKMADAVNHPDCDGCADMARCAQEISAAGARVQVVPLKNGVMYVYTVESSAGVRAVQAAVMHRNERLAALVTAGDHAKLCGRCKEMRGAAASGKLSREVVNIEGGCLTLMTSSDPVIVQRLHEMANASLVSVRTKS